MNLVEYYIVEIHSEEDVSDQFEKVNGYKPMFPLIKVDATLNCYGVEERKTMMMQEDILAKAKVDGYFLG